MKLSFGATYLNYLQQIRLTSYTLQCFLPLSQSSSTHTKLLKSLHILSEEEIFTRVLIMKGANEIFIRKSCSGYLYQSTVSDSSSLVFVAASGGAKDHIREALLAYS